MYIPDRFNHLYGIPLIMEVGSLNTKIGFAGKDRPDVIAPSVPFINYLVRPNQQINRLEVLIGFLSALRQVSLRSRKYTLKLLY